MRQKTGRRSPRYPFHARLALEWGSAMLGAEVCDLSCGGMFLRMAQPLWVGATFSARLALDQPIEVDCVVRRVVPGHGVGVEFLQVPETTHSRLVSLLEELSTLAG